MMDNLFINIYLIIGLQGSGKTTYLNEKVDPNIYYFSADKYRRQFLNYDNEMIFNRLYADLALLIRNISNGSEPNLPIYLDNTHISMKSRRKFFDYLDKIKKNNDVLCFVTGLIMATPFELCLERVHQRNQKYDADKIIPDEVLFRYRSSFNIPLYTEGFNDLKIIDGVTFEEITNVEWNKAKFDAIYPDFLSFDQENPHHKYTLGQHMDLAQNMVEENENAFSDANVMYIAASVHDWGKMYTKQYKEDGNACYYNHGEVGAYILLTNLDLIPQTDLSMQDFLKLLAYVNYHMKPFDWKTEKTLEKAKKKYGEVLVYDLLAFNSIDCKACGTESELE